MRPVAVARYVALGGPMHGRLLDATSEEVSIRGTLYRQHKTDRNEKGALFIWEGLDPDEVKLLVSEWTR